MTGYSERRDSAPRVGDRAVIVGAATGHTLPLCTEVTVTAASGGTCWTVETDSGESALVTTWDIRRLTDSGSTA